MKSNLKYFLIAGLTLTVTPLLAVPESSTSVSYAQVSRPGNSIFWDNLQRDPVARGWKQSALSWEKFKGKWSPAEGGNPAHVTVSEGYWESPLIPVQAFGYYRMQFQSRAPKNGFCWAYFYDAAGNELIPDNHDNFFASNDWSDQQFVFRAYALATQMRLRFQADKTPIDIANVSLQPVDTETALEWTRDIRRTIPEIRYVPPTDRGSLLPITASRLKNGGKLRIVMLGDSICNDTSNSLYETQLSKLYPRTKFEVVTSVRGGTLSTWYQKENRVQDYVLRFNPDLLIIAGISHGNDVEAIRNVVRQVRAKSDADILVLSDSITPEKEMIDGYLKYSGVPERIARDNIRLFPQRLLGMTRVEDVEYLDMRTAWNEYLRQSPQPVEWFMRDPIHGNRRAKQVVGTILARYLAFVPA